MVSFLSCVVHASWLNIHRLSNACPKNVRSLDILNEVRREVPVENAPDAVPVENAPTTDLSGLLMLFHSVEILDAALVVALLLDVIQSAYFSEFCLLPIC